MPEAISTPTTPRPIARRRANKPNAGGETAIALAIGAKPSRGRSIATTIPGDMPLGSVRTMELQGLTADGRLVKFWDDDYPIQRVDRFLINGRGIKSGKYLLSYHGHLVTAHCGSGTLGGQMVVTVDIMCNDCATIFLPREQVEPMLFGYVVPDEAKEAEILRMLKQITANLRNRNDTADRQRGHL